MISLMLESRDLRRFKRGVISFSSHLIVTHSGHTNDEFCSLFSIFIKQPQVVCLPLTVVLPVKGKVSLTSSPLSPAKPANSLKIPEPELSTKNFPKNAIEVFSLLFLPTILKIFRFSDVTSSTSVLRKNESISLA